MQRLKPEPWMVYAVCSQTDPEVFFPEKGGRSESAKQICQRCPVIEECLAYATEHDEMGVWGGTSEKQRIATRRGQAVA